MRLPGNERGERDPRYRSQRARCAEGRKRIAGPRQQAHVAVDRRDFVRKLPDEIVTKRVFASFRVIYLVTDVKTVELLVHRCPLELASRQEVEHPPRAGLCADLADVVHADIPFVTVALVGMGEAPGRVVLLEHTDLATELALQRRCRQATHARADDEDVVGVRQSARPVAPADTQCAWGQLCHDQCILARYGFRFARPIRDALPG